MRMPLVMANSRSECNNKGLGKELAKAEEALFCDKKDKGSLEWRLRNMARKETTMASMEVKESYHFSKGDMKRQSLRCSSLKRRSWRQCWETRQAG